MSQSMGRDGFTSHTRPTGSAPYVSPMTSPNTPLRHPQQHSAQSGLPTQLIPRDYLSSLSKARSNGASTGPTPPPTLAVSPPPSEPSKSLGLVDRSVLRDDSDDSDDSEIEKAGVTRPIQPLELVLNVARTRQPASANPHAELAKRSNPSPESPASVTSSATTQPSIPNDMPRTSSIDSAISTISTSSWPQKSSNEIREPNFSEIRNLIATAGSAENLVQHLLRDKAHAASQNAQLWKLVDKQRALLLGLNKDLERVTKERDRYRKKAKELQTSQITDHAAHSQTPPTSARREPEPIPNSGDMLLQADSDWSENPRAASNGIERSPVERGMMPSPLHLQQHPEMAQKEASISTIPVVIQESAPQTQSQKAHATPKLASLATQLAAPAVNLVEVTPLAESPAKSFANSRKNAPRSLDLKQTTQQQQLANDEVLEDSDFEPEPLGRGRRKTREEDDREREIVVMQEQEARSRSIKEKRSKEKLKKDQDSSAAPQSPTVAAPLPPSQATIKEHLPAPLPGGLAAFRMQTPEGHSSLSPPLRSPGLPASPRPMDRPLASPLPTHMTEHQQSLNSLPMSPRNGGFPLSPRAPKQALPTNVNPGTIPVQKRPEPERPHVETVMSPADVPPVYRGLVSPTFPDLLLPPNAIPSIQIKVASSRLKPSRFSVLGLKPQEDTSVFSLSIYSRSSYSELWRIEKIPAALPHLDQQLRQRVPNVPKLPDRKLFSGHAPATVDARRNAIEAYFEELLDTQVDEAAAVMLCKFLSTDVLEPPSDSTNKKGQASNTQSSLQVDAYGRMIKSGFLTKKGKNFGGWKSRYFVLDSPELRYFESQGGAHLGTIKLSGARIGRQTSDSIADQGEDEGQFRHAFLILEPKRKDSNSYVRHVLCAENDMERDEWVQALLHYVEEKVQDARPTTSGATSDVSGSLANPRQLLRGTEYADGNAESVAQASSPARAPSGSPSTSSTSSANAEMEAQRSAHYPPHFNAALAQRHAKQHPQAAPPQREQKIRNLFQFKQKSSQEHLNAQAQAQAQKNHKDHAYVRPVFGLPLAEAVEMCPPEDVDVLLPAVVYRCIEYLQGKKAANEEGLFRLSGSNLVIRSLKERFNTEGDVNLLNGDEYYDVHAVASLFKTYLRELPSTILTRDLHLEFLRVLELDDKENKIGAFNSLVHRLPDVNYALLRALSAYLIEVVQNQDRNKMTVKNVGIVFSPTLNIPAPVFSMFLTDFDAIFERRQDEPPPQTLLAAPRGSNDEDVRSPRHQMFSDLPSTPYNLNSFQQNQQQHQHHQQAQQQHYENPAASYHGSDSRAEFGLSPVQRQASSYETRQYVSIPQQQALNQGPPPQPMYMPPALDQPRQMQYRMTVPEGGSEKAKRRESAMFFG